MSKVDLYNGDCLEVMDRLIEEGVKVDMVLCDPPYGTTACSWDNVIPFDKMWDRLNKLIKDNGAICLFSSGLYTYKIINSNTNLYKYKWIWFKTKRGNFVNAKNRPMTAYEEICVFSKGGTANGSKNKMVYYPQGLIPFCKEVSNGKSKFGTIAGKRPSHQKKTFREFTNYPHDVLEFSSVPKPVHPTQKPTDLLEYLIKTYTLEEETVLDFTAGSGSTGVACVNTNRDFIGIELDKGYYDIMVKRIEEAKGDNISEYI